jgi:hypothetical protein
MQMVPFSVFTAQQNMMTRVSVSSGQLRKYTELSVRFILEIHNNNAFNAGFCQDGPFGK